jgi:hypothetical protein
MEVYHQLCTKELIPKNRQKDVMTALRYLAGAHESIPDRLTLTLDIEANYRDRLRTYLTAQGKHLTRNGTPSVTIRNSNQSVGQFLKAYHQMVQTPVIPRMAPRFPTFRQAREGLGPTSPYRHFGWMRRSNYKLPIDQWPSSIAVEFEKYRKQQKDHLRAATINKIILALESYLGYLSLDGDARLDRLPPASRQKLALPRYADDLDMIVKPLVCASWADLFVLDHLRGFVTWHAWRIHTPMDAQVLERPPSRPSALGYMVADEMVRLADSRGRKPHAKALRTYCNDLPKPRKIHNKAAEYHNFSFAELEQIALALMDEARHMGSRPKHGKHPTLFPGSKGAGRFMAGLVLMLGWRIPLRLRNWCEALLEVNLRRVNGGWRWHFEGDELKVGARRGQTNVYDIEIPPEVVPYLEEYLTVWRPKFPHAESDRHVFLTLRQGGGGMLTSNDLYMKLKVHVYRFTGKRLFPHLLRTIFTSSHLSSGVDINSVAYGLGDTPTVVLGAYNELQAGKHGQSLQESNRRALNGNGNGTTP